MGDIFDALGDATRRRILELTAGGEQSVGQIVAALGEEVPISQPGVSQHLAVLREVGLVRVRAEGTRRYYTVAEEGLQLAHAWLERIADPAAAFAQPLDALETEIARGQRSRRRAERAPRAAPRPEPHTDRRPA